MYFVYNSKTREVIGLYNKRDVKAICELNENVMPIPTHHAENIMKEQIWEIDPNFYADMWSSAEDIYKQYIRRNSLRRTF